MLLVETEVTRGKDVGVEVPAEEAPANGGMPSFGGTWGTGIWIGAVGGAACHIALIASVTLGMLILRLLSGGLLPGEVVSGLLGALAIGIFGLLFAVPIGMIIGAISSTLMWLVLRFLPRRDERTRILVGMACGFVTAVLAVLSLFLLVEGPNWSNFTIFMDDIFTWVFGLEGLAVTLTGGWFARRYLA